MAQRGRRPVIASHAHRAIFVKTRKTAGTSIEIAFSAVCGERDVITPLVPEDEELRRAAGGRAPQHHRPGLLHRLQGRRGGATNHMSAAAVRDLLGRPTWEAYLTFAVERNPWDRAVSLYYYRTRGQPAPVGFGAFLRTVEPARLSNWDTYALDGRVGVDLLLRYEELGGELAALWARLGVSPPELRRAKGGLRPRQDYRALYGEGDAQLVADHCGREIAALGYTFDPA